MSRLTAWHDLLNIMHVFFCSFPVCVMLMCVCLYNCTCVYTYDACVGEDLLFTSQPDMYYNDDDEKHDFEHKR